MNIQRKNSFLGNIYLSVFTNDYTSDEAVIYFHGFPGPTLDNPVISLSELLAESLGDTRTLYAPRYSGLAESNGQFSFLSSIYDGLSVLYQVLSKRYTKISIIGYSWGAVVALNCFDHIPPHKRGRLVLLAPVTQLPKNDVAKYMAEALIQSSPWSLRHQTTDSIALDLKFIDAEHNPFAAAQRIGAERICVIQGMRDEVVLKSVTDEFVASLGEGTSYIVFDEPHSFADKSTLMEAIKNAIDC